VTISIQETATHEPSLEVLIRALSRLTLSSYMAILSEIRLALLEVDKRAYPDRTSRIDWGIRELSSVDDIRVVLAPVRPPAHRNPSTLIAPTVGLVEGIRELGTESAIPPLFSPLTVERVQRMGLNIESGAVAEVQLVSVNGHREGATVNAEVVRRAKEAVTPASTAWGSVNGRLAVIDAKNPNRLKAEVTLATRGALTIWAGAEHTEELKMAWGQRVLAAGELTRNSLGQPVRMRLEELEVLPEPEERLTAWEILGVAPRATGDLSTQQHLAELRHG
jgi:hypothetical protein